jgi:thiamine transport system substrate-binding protein
VVSLSRLRTLGYLFLGLLVLLVFANYIIRKPELFPKRNTLFIYSYPSFLNAWGPGPQLIREFEKTCDCHVQTVQVDDSSLMIQKLLSEKKKRVDLVIGLDQMHLSEARERLEWQVLFELTDRHSDIEFSQDKLFAPLDWAPLTFIYRKSEVKKPPTSLDDFLKPEWRNSIALQDPRTSTVGLQFVSWVHLLKKDKALEFLKQLKPALHSISPSWSTAYGLFKKKQSKFVYSYLTSPVYHWVEDKDLDYQPLVLKEKLAVQHEWIAVPKDSGNTPLAISFIEFLLSDSAQRVIMQKNFMFPAKEAVMAGTPFGSLPLVETFLLSDYTSIQLKDLLDLWSQI